MAWKVSKMTAPTIEQLKVWFSMGFTDIEASLFAGIAPRTLYDYCSKNKAFAELKEILKEQPKINAKANIIASINSKSPMTYKQRIDDSKWWLERRAKSEFSLRQEIQAEIEWDITVKFEM